MENPSHPDLGELTNNILLFELDLNEVFAARQEIILRIESRAHSQEDIRNYNILSKRIISTVERKKRTLEEIDAYYSEYEPENIRRSMWLLSLEASKLELAAHQSALDDFFNNGHTKKTNDLFLQYDTANKIAHNITDKIDPALRTEGGKSLFPQHHTAQQTENPAKKTNNGTLPGLAAEFLKAGGPSLETLILGKLVKSDGTELKLPHCGIDSFQKLEEYYEKFENLLSEIIKPNIQAIYIIKTKILASIYSKNPQILKVLNKVQKHLTDEVEKAEEISKLLKSIKVKTSLPVTIDAQLEANLIRLDNLHAELVKIMLDALEAQRELHTLTKPRK